MIFGKKKKLLVWCDDPPEDRLISVFAGCLVNHDLTHILRGVYVRVFSVLLALIVLVWHFLPSVFVLFYTTVNQHTDWVSGISKRSPQLPTPVVSHYDPWSYPSVVNDILSVVCSVQFCVFYINVNKQVLHGDGHRRRRRPLLLKRYGLGDIPPWLPRTYRCKYVNRTDNRRFQ